MGTDAPMATHTDVLTLSQWFSPAFPVGAFAYSHGLEWTIETGEVRDAASTETWLETVLRDGAGWNDAVLLSAAFQAETDDAIQSVDATCRALAASRERLLESERLGAAFCETVSAVWGAELRGLTYPVAVGRAARLEGLPVLLTTQLFLQAFISTLASVAVRLVPLGQTDGQRLILALTPHCAEVAEQAVTADLSDLRSSAFLTDIAAMKHETQHTRIFRT